MTSNQQKETFTVPVGTRLSHGIELEFLVAYLYPDEADPDEQHSADLAPILRIARRGFLAAENDVQEHIRMTLRNHRIRVNNKNSMGNEDAPLHLRTLDRWDVDIDPSVTNNAEEAKLVRGKAGAYRWLGVELRSPACWDVTDAYNEIRFVVNLIKSKYRVRVNPSCGFHVHVANGPRYFDAKTLKRAGAFLFAADPMLSRLHAPWRRVAQYSLSIRYRCRLACWDGMQPADAQAFVDRDAGEVRDITGGLGSMNAIPVVPWSDTSMEEAELMGRSKWEQYAKERVRNEPFMTLNVRPPAAAPEPSEISSVAITERSRPSSPPSSLFLPRGPPDDDGNDNDDDDDNDDNNAGAYQRRFQALMETEEFRERCRTVTGQLPNGLTGEEQYFVLSLIVCKKMFRHSRIEDLTDEQYHLIVMACAPYVEVSRSSFAWNAEANVFNLKHSLIGEGLDHPRPLRLNKFNAESILQNMEAQVDNGEVNVDLSDEGDVGFPPDQIDRSTRGVIDDLRKYPSFPEELIPKLMVKFENMAEARRRNQKYLDASRQGGDQTTTDAGRASRPPSKSGSGLPANSRASSPRNVGGSGGGLLPYPTTPSNDQNPPSGGGDGFELAFPRPPSAGALPPYPTTPSNEAGSSSSRFDSISLTSNPGPDLGPSYGSGSPRSSANDLGLRGGFSRPPSAPENDDNDSSFVTSESSGGFNPPAFQALLGSRDDITLGPRTSASSSFQESVSSIRPRNSRAEAAPKLQPHNFLDFSNSYLARIAIRMSLDSQYWDRIAWLPYPGGRPDPRDPHPRFGETCPGPDCRQHAVTDTRAGLATILGVDSGAALGSLLECDPDPGEPLMNAPRANYNFKSYASHTLRGGRRSGEKRTIEFREAAGSLDAEWIVLWTKICVGIMRFCREAMVSDFITVLERIVREEEGQRTDDWEVRYDVCDLLEDICLFTEAEVVRRREREHGPPR